MTEDIQAIKRKFGILGNNNELNRAIEVAVKVAVTDMSVLVMGESGVGKEVFSKIIHQCSSRKHNKYIAVNCGAIPEGTIESELFGHVKGAFTNADRDRKGYFAEADKGTIFLDEVGELPMSMQVKLLRVLESGEYIPVGSSKTLHCDVRIVAATNVNLLSAIEKGLFREDLYYRLNQISINIPPLRERKDDIYMLFMRFAVDQAEKYNMPHITLREDAREYLKQYPWNGNVRQLKNVAEQISIIETSRSIDAQTLKRYIPLQSSLPVLFDNNKEESVSDDAFQTLIQAKRDIELLKNEVSQLKDIVRTIITNGGISNTLLLNNPQNAQNNSDNEIIDVELNNETNLNIEDLKKQAVIDALKRHKGKRKEAAEELGISDRTLYRKIIEY
ncbi:MAG: sigma-54-dependent Fis family transcriptional regulator [Bacteroidales bacterium]|nr:sigma-54-dependent Fis family transcriptional regulator [Bacteroidales bacterium]